jgi:hypothetical protein
MGVRLCYKYEGLLSYSWKEKQKELYLSGPLFGVEILLQKDCSKKCEAVFGFKKQKEIFLEKPETCM